MCVGLPGKVIKVDGEQAIVDVAGVPRRVSIAILRLEGLSLTQGDWVLASAGLAVRRLDEEDAVDLLGTLEGGA